MKRLVITVMAIALAGLVAAGCSQAAPAPAKPPAAPTAAPAKVEYPQKGKAVTYIVPFAPGGATDIGSRLLAAQLEKELGVPFEVVNKEGASSQVGLTDLFKSKPDGYTIGAAGLPTSALVYLDEKRKAAFGRKDVQPLANFYADPDLLAVGAKTGIKDLKTLIDQAKANPGKIRVASSGLGGDDHLAGLMLAKLFGVRFGYVHFDGGAPRNAAILGGNAEVMVGGVVGILPLMKSGDVNVLAILDSDETPAMPGVKTLKAQGYDYISGANRGLAVPAGTPKEIITILNNAIEKAVKSPEVAAKLKDMGVQARYEDAAGYSARWDAVEKAMKEALALLAETTK